MAKWSFQFEEGDQFVVEAETLEEARELAKADPRSKGRPFLDIREVGPLISHVSGKVLTKPGGYNPIDVKNTSRSELRPNESALPEEEGEE